MRVKNSGIILFLFVLCILVGLCSFVGVDGNKAGSIIDEYCSGMNGKLPFVARGTDEDSHAAAEDFPVPNPESGSEIPLSSMEALVTIGEPADGSGSVSGSNETAEDSNITEVKALVGQLESSDYNTRLDAMETLGDFGDPAADILIQALDDSLAGNKEVNGYAVLALLETGDERAEETLFRVLEEEASLHERASLSGQVSGVFEPESESGAGPGPGTGPGTGPDAGPDMSADLSVAVEGRDRMLRGYIAASLEARKNEADVSALIEALNSEEQDADSYIRIALREGENPGSGPEYGNSSGAEYGYKPEYSYEPEYSSGSENGYEPEYDYEPENSYGSENSYGDEDNTEMLLEALKNEDGCVRVAASLALGEMREEIAAESLLQLLTKDYREVRNSAALALGMIGSERAVEPLINELKHNDDVHVQCSAALALGKIGDERAVSPLIQKLYNKNTDVRNSAAVALACIGDERAERAVEPLIEIVDGSVYYGSMRLAFVEEDAELKKNAVLALGEIGDKRARKVLSDILEDNGKDEELRIASVSALGKIGDPRSVELLVEVLNDESESIRLRKEAVSALGRMEDIRGARALVPFLTDSELGTPAAEALAEIGDIAIDPLVEVLNEETGDIRLRKDAVSLLGRIGNRRSAEALVPFLTDSELGGVAGEALAGMGGTAVEPLIEALDRSDKALRIEISLLLIETGDERAVDPLFRMFR